MATVSLLETASSSLLEPPKFRLSSLKFHSLSRVSSPTLFPFRKHHQHIRFTPHSPLHNNLRALAPLHATSQPTGDDTSNPLDKLLNAILKTINSLKKPAIVAILLGVLVLGDPFNHALAASGGSIGGSSWSSSDSSSSYSSWSSSSDYSSSTSSDDTWSSSSDDYDTTPSYSSSKRSSKKIKSSSSDDCDTTPSYSSSKRSSEKIKSSSSDSSGSNSKITPSYSTSFSSPVVQTGPVVSSDSKTMSNVHLILMGFSAFVLSAGVLAYYFRDHVLTQTKKTSVIKLQVGLLGSARSFQRDLDQLAEKADTSTKAGLSYVLTEAISALLRHPDSFISAYSLVDIKRSGEGREKLFNQLSIEERGKFDEETLVNLNNIKRRKSVNDSSSSFSNEYIVTTILVAAEGVHELPVINSSSDLKIALQKLSSISSSKLQAVQVLWTPQKEGDTLSERELLEDYPLLRPL